MGALAFADREQQRWLLRHGFPMPRGMARRTDMADHELATLAERGNLKARMVYADRLAADRCAAGRRSRCAGFFIQARFVPRSRGRSRRHVATTEPALEQ